MLLKATPLDYSNFSPNCLDLKSGSKASDDHKQFDKNSHGIPKASQAQTSPRRLSIGLLADSMGFL